MQSVKMHGVARHHNCVSGRGAGIQGGAKYEGTKTVRNAIQHVDGDRGAGAVAISKFWAVLFSHQQVPSMLLLAVAIRA